MYNTSNKKEAIREIQIYLGAGKHAVIPTGVYDQATRKSVMDFQKEHQLTESGTVDRETFDAIYKEYLAKKIKDNAAKHSRNIGFPIKFGDQGDQIYQINSLLKALAFRYNESNSIQGSFFGHESERITERLREIFRLHQDPFIDEELYIRIIQIYDAVGEKRLGR